MELIPICCPRNGFLSRSICELRHNLGQAYLEKSDLWVLGWKLGEEELNRLARSAPLCENVDHTCFMIVDHSIELLLTLELEYYTLSFAVVKSRGLVVLRRTKIHGLRIILTFHSPGVKHRMGLGIRLVLHSANHVADHRAHRGLEDLERKIHDVLWDSGAQQKSCALVSEMVAIIFEQVVSLHAEF